MPHLDITAYDQLSREEQEKIDLAIFGEEIAASQGEPRHPSITLPSLPENIETRIKVLQDLYAMDMQGDHPSFYPWHEDVTHDREQVRAFIEDIRGDTEIAKAVHLDELLTSLTNLPGAALHTNYAFASREPGHVSYHTLSPRLQQLIDAAILMEEVYETTYGVMRPLLPNLPTDPEQRVNYLRDLYAQDSQEMEPAYFQWRTEAAATLNEAKSILYRYETGGYTDDHPVAAVIPFLDNLPKLEQMKDLAPEAQVTPANVTAR